MVKLILHCSNSSFTNAALIAKWHSLPAREVVQNGRKYVGSGWIGTGYHNVMLNGWMASNSSTPRFNGHIETSSPLEDDPVVSRSGIRAHVKGYNTKSVGICIIAKSGQFAQDQLNTSLRLEHDQEEQIQDVQVLQHSDLDQKKNFCAGLDMAL